MEAVGEVEGRRGGWREGGTGGYKQFSLHFFFSQLIPALWPLNEATGHSGGRRQGLSTVTTAVEWNKASQSSTTERCAKPIARFHLGWKCYLKELGHLSLIVSFLVNQFISLFLKTLHIYLIGLCYWLKLFHLKLISFSFRNVFWITSISEQIKHSITYFTEYMTNKLFNHYDYYSKTNTSYNNILVLSKVNADVILIINNIMKNVISLCLKIFTV